MPRSDQASHPFLCAAVRARLPVGRGATVLDCGVGAGLIAHALRDVAGLRIHGFEIFAPYVFSTDKQREIGGDFHHELYERIDVCDFAQVLTTLKTRYDFIIFGDSLMQLGPERAEHALRHALRLARRAVLVNATIRPFGQGPAYGNERERHLFSWPCEVWTALGGQHLGGNDLVGSFVWDIPAWRERARFFPLGLAEQAAGSRFDHQGALRYDAPVVDPATLRPRSPRWPRPERCLIAVANYGRRGTAVPCITQLSRTRGAATLWLYDDCSPDFEPGDWEGLVDRVIRAPHNRGINACRMQNLRDFWASDFDFLYMTDNDAFHDPDWLLVARQLYARWRLPVTLFDSVFHQELRGLGPGARLKRSFPGISLFLDRACAARVLTVYDVGDSRGGPFRPWSSWDWVYGEILGNCIVTSIPSRVDHYGAGGLHNHDNDVDQAQHPTPFLAQVRAERRFG